MIAVTIEEAQARLPELIDRLTAGGELTITRGQSPVAKLILPSTLCRQPRKAGSARGLLTILHDDDEHLEDFADYMK
jgi:antitoxin (DNA-binding transcriptional repressor) of toxin-antitoxin stability system